MSTVRVNSIYDTSGGNNAQLFGVASPPNSMGFRNRIINGGMSVWQRGTSFSVSAGQYAQDRWLLFAPSGTFGSARSTDVPSGFQFSAELTGTNASFTQRIEAANCFDLVGQSVTVSFWAKNVSGTQALFVELQRPNAEDNWTGLTSVSSTTVAASPSSNWTYYTTTFTNLPAGVANGLSCVIGRAAGGATTTRITGVQLEAGSVATPFERRPYGTELALCQRYYYRVTGSGFSYIATGQVANSTQAVVWTPFPVALRAVPANLEQSGTASHYAISQANTSSTACTSVPVFNAATLAGASSVFTSSSLGGTAGQATFGMSNNTSAAFLAWSAEL